MVYDVYKESKTVAETFTLWQATVFFVGRGILPSRAPHMTGAKEVMGMATITIEVEVVSVQEDTVLVRDSEGHEWLVDRQDIDIEE